MAAQIVAPKLGMSTAPLTLVEWKAKEGDWIEQGDIVLVIETEKIRHDIQAEISGFVHILVEKGNKVPIGTVIGLIAETKEEFETLQKEKPKGVITTAARGKGPSPVSAAAPSPAGARGGRIPISPVARKMAEEHMIDIAAIVGTGPGGRIVREDIEKAIEAKKTAEVTPDLYEGRRVKSVIPLTGMREAIAEHMHRSLSISAQLTLAGEIEMTEMVKLRESLVGQAEALGAKITYTALFVFAIAKALREHPMINSSLIDNEIKLWENINIGVVVSLEEGLIVPVVKDADEKSLVETSQTIKTLAQKAREAKLTPDEVIGGTFTITNLGALGGGYRFETAIINQPESAILGIGGITDRAVVREGKIVIRPIMTYYFTYDHRVIDGAVATRFMDSVIQLLENPGPLSI